VIRNVASKNTPGTTPSASFVTFSELPDSHLLGVARDSSIVFDSMFGSPKQILSLVRAKEVVRALLVEVIIKSKASTHSDVSSVAPGGDVVPIVVTEQCSSTSGMGDEDSIPIAQWAAC
jgi:hypothetical protein